MAADESVQGLTATNLSLAWIVFTADYLVYASVWVVVAVVLIAVYGPTHLSRSPRQQVISTDVRAARAPAPAGVA